MKCLAIAAAAAVGFALASTASANTGAPWFDSFEGGVGSSYQPWPGGSQSNLQGSTAHAFSGTGSAWQVAADPEAYSSTYTLSNTTSGVTGALETDVYVYDDNSVSNTANTPVNAGITLAGANGTSTPGFGTDYAELGLIAGTNVNANDYVIRVASNDAAGGQTWFDTGVGRTAGWTHLQILADALPSAGGDGLYHFFINGVNVDPTTLSRNNVGLEWDRIGWNSKSSANFWYDNFAVNTPEPASLSLMGLGALGLLKRRRRQI